MKISILFVILLFFINSCEKDLSIPIPDPSEDVDYSDHPKHWEYQTLLDKYQKQTNSPGSVLLIYRTGESVWVGSTGKSNLKHQTPMQTNTQFRIGSITKLFVATAIMQLAESEKLNLTGSLDYYLPGVKDNIPQSHKITVLQLLAHLSGIFDPINESTRYKLDLINDPDKIDAMSIDQLLKTYVYGEPLHFDPGSNYAYSNVNYWLLGQIIEKITEKSLATVLDDLIIRPLGLEKTFLEQRDDRNISRGYADIYGDGHLLDVTQWERAEVDGNAAGGIISTASDLSKFTEALMTGKIVTPTSLELMKKIQLENCNSPECESGLGLDLWRTGAGIGYGKNGTTAGTESNVVYFPGSGNMFVIFKNNGAGSDKSFLDDLMK